MENYFYETRKLQHVRWKIRHAHNSMFRELSQNFVAQSSKGLFIRGCDSNFCATKRDQQGNSHFRQAGSAKHSRVNGTQRALASFG